MPSGVVPKSVTSTMFGWPMREAALASCTKRSIVAVSRVDLALEHLDRERPLDHAWRAAKTTPMPPSPILRSM